MDDSLVLDNSHLGSSSMPEDKFHSVLTEPHDTTIHDDSDTRSEVYE